MSSEDIYVKVNALHRLGIIAAALSPEEVRGELLPYLESLQSEEEEVLFALAEALGELHQHLRPASCLVPILEHLASLDETVVREEAARSLIKVASAMPNPEIDSVLAPALLRLASADTFSAQVSAISLCSVTYARSSTFKDRIRAKLIELSRDETPMVRRAAALQMGPFATVAEKHVIVNELLTELRQLAQDEQDQIRMLYIDGMITISSLLTKEENKMNTLPVILAIGEDKSWKVRYHFAKLFPQLAGSLGRDITESFFGKFKSFLKYNENFNTGLHHIIFLE